MEIGWHAGDRTELRPLFALAEDSQRRLEAALGRGRILEVRDAGAVVACLQLAGRPSAGEREVLTLAVAERRQGQGIGRALVERAVAECRTERARTLLVASAAADTGNLRFYQRLGFRMLRVERDAFTPSEGYAEGIEIDGIPLRDRVWLDMLLS